MKTFRILFLLWLTAALAVSAQEVAEFETPGWFRSMEKPLAESPVVEWSASREVDTATGVSGGSGGGYHMFTLVSPPEIAEAGTAEILALARGLENDPVKIFAYVRDHIRYVHYFGSKKGAQLTLLERSGNDLDQCALLVALLRAAGQTAGYRFGTVLVPYELTDTHRDFKHWLGLSKPNTNWTEALQFARSLNDYREFPFSGSFANVTNYLVFHHAWVRLTWNSAVYSLDPAFKIYEPVAGTNLVAGMGLDTNQLMTAAGGTSTADYVQSLSETGLRNQLGSYTTNLLGYFQNNFPNATVAEVFGEQKFSGGQTFGASLPFSPYVWDTNSQAVDWTYIPTNLMVTLNVTVDATTNRLLFMPQLQGQRLSLTFDANGLGQLWLDDDQLLQKQTSGGSTVNVAMKVDHPNGYWDWAGNKLINTNWNDHVVTNSYQRTNASYAITYAFEPDQDWLRQRQDRLDRYRQQGLADTSREVTTETLNIMGLNWMLQTERIGRVLTAQQDILLQHHHRLGRMGQEAGKGYYIDVYQQLSGNYPASGNSTNDRDRSDRMFDLESYFASAAEHGLIEQLQSSNLLAASTVKMLQLGNANGQRTYLAKSANWSSIQGNLSNYSLNYLKTNYIDRGYSLLLPANGSNLLAGAGSWFGYGAVARGVTTNASGVFQDMVMLISGGYHGGYVSAGGAVVEPPFVQQSSFLQSAYFGLAPALVGTPFGADPVSMADGAFNLSTLDLSLGQPEPRGISLTRHYASSRRLHNLAGLAPGWVHNYYFRAGEVSAPLPALGDTTPAQMAAMIVAAKSAGQLYATAGSPKNWAVTALIAKWGIDQLTGNAVSVALGKDTLQFIRQPDGTFTPPAKATQTLVKTNGAYWLQERHGNTYKFNAAGWLTSIADQFNQSLTVTYNASNWVSTVQDWKNRQFTFNYSGAPLRLTSITDNTSPARTVTYDYTGSGNQFDLTSVTDAEGKTSTFLYDTNHQIVATKDALNRTVVSNRYDSFGRVIEQCSQGDTNQTWQLFWSGFANTQQDPAGGRTQFFYDDKHRLTRTIDPLNHYADSIYDGQDQVVRTISELFAITDYSYDGRHNLTAVNDPLGAQDDYYYDAQDNRYRIWDKRSQNSYFGYNAKFQLTGSTNGAGDWMNYTYNADGTLATKTDAGGATTFGYDSFGQLKTVTYPNGLGGVTNFNNALGDVTNHVDARGFATAMQYNNRRELTNTIAPTNVTVKIVMDAVGNVTSTTDALGNVTSNAWSATRKLLKTTLPATPQGNPTVSNVYDNRDWLLRTINNQLATISYSNDAGGHLIAMTDPVQRPNWFAYDGDDRKIASTNGISAVTRQTWDARGSLIQLTDGAGHVSSRVYDEAGNQITLTNRNGKKWQFQYDSANRLTNTITPLNRSTMVSFNQRGLMSTTKDPAGQMTTLGYDAKGRLTNRTDNVASTIYKWDANDNQTNVIENGQTNAWTYDAYNRPASYRDVYGNLIQYKFDANGNLTNLIYPGGKTVTNTYDSLNRLTSVTDWTGRKTSIAYDLNSRVTSLVRPNGSYRTIGYDLAGQATNIIEQMSNSLPIALFKLNWDAAARAQWEFTAPLPHSVTMPTRTMTYDDDNRLATVNGSSVTSDANGNLISAPLTNATFATQFFDARNRLLSAGGVTNAYDAMNNRIGQTQGTNVTTFVVNPNAKLPQVLMRVKNGVTNYYIYGAGLLYQITETATATNTLTYHYDFRGSTVALSADSGAVTDRMEYSAYGLTTYRLGTSDTPFLFNGRYGVHTDANGLLYMRARYYNPYLCRFLNADPSGFAGGLNHYAYANGNPISLVDPFGLNARATGDTFWSWLGSRVNSLFDMSGAGPGGLPSGGQLSHAAIDNFVEAATQGGMGRPMADSFQLYDPQSSIPLWADLATVSAGAMLGMPEAKYSTPAAAAETTAGRNIVGTTFDAIRPTQDIIHPDIVAQYVSDIRAGNQLKPISIGQQANGNLYILDGHHRFVAGQLEGVQVPQIITQGAPTGLPNWSSVIYQPFTPAP